MNILYLCDEYPPCQHGGIGTVTQSLAREIRKKGHNVIVCGLYPYYRIAKAIEDDSGVIVFRRFYGNRLHLKISRNQYLGHFHNIINEFNAYIDFIHSLIRDYKIDIIEMPDFNEVFHYSGPRFINYPDFGIPVVVKLHGTYSFVNHTVDGFPLKESIYQKEKYLVHHATKVVAVSNFSRNEAIKIFDYSKKISVIYNGISIENPNRYVKNTINGPVIYAGTLAEQKGVFALIKAWRSVIKEIPSARLFLYGKGDPKTIDRIIRSIPEEDLNSVEIKGFIKKAQLQDIYRTASCAVFPSYVESFSLAPLESMLEGCPTIYTSLASGSELIIDGFNGLLVNPINPLEIANAIIKMLKDRSFALKMGEQGTITVIEKFDISSIADKHISEYQAIVKGF